MAETKKYNVVADCECDGKACTPGQVVELTDAQAKALEGKVEVVE